NENAKVEEQHSAVVSGLNSILQGSSIYDSQRFQGVKLSAETSRLKEESPTEVDPVRFNRLLLEDAYPLEIAKSLCCRSDVTDEPHDGLVSGSAVVGASGPLTAVDLGEPLFTETAHHFSVFVSKAQVPKARDRELLQKWIEAERPAHTDYDLCVVEPRMR